MFVCSEHFKKEDYFWSHSGKTPLRRRLKAGVVPSRKIPVGVLDRPPRMPKKTKSKPTDEVEVYVSEITTRRWSTAPFAG
ncbi:hypothetical protein V5799_008716 [Amblyomma americanum]|uniref:THAP-type domain-containing protein n=1 Tax=Amblyomma americanum TaxID=6943 RepID=A0AAQ4FDW3_AMBAM